MSRVRNSVDLKQADSESILFCHCEMALPSIKRAQNVDCHSRSGFGLKCHVGNNSMLNICNGDSQKSCVCTGHRPHFKPQPIQKQYFTLPNSTSVPTMPSIFATFTVFTIFVVLSDTRLLIGYFDILLTVIPIIYRTKLLFSEHFVRKVPLMYKDHHEQSNCVTHMIHQWYQILFGTSTISQI